MATQELQYVLPKITECMITMITIEKDFQKRYVESSPINNKFQKALLSETIQHKGGVPDRMMILELIKKNRLVKEIALQSLQSREPEP